MPGRTEAIPWRFRVGQPAIAHRLHTLVLDRTHSVHIVYRKYYI